MRLRISDPESFGAGAIFVALSLAFLLGAGGIDHGRLSRMGPGYMPRYVAGMLGLIGMALLWRGLRRQGGRLPPLRPRAVICTLAAVLAFAFALPVAGLAVTAAGTVLLAAAARPGQDWPRIAILAVGLSASSCLLFPVALGLALPIWPGALR